MNKGKSLITGRNNLLKTVSFYRFFFVLFTVGCCAQALFAQTGNGLENLQLQEKRLKVLGLETVDCREAEEREKTMESFFHYLKEALKEPNSFDYPFDSVKTMLFLYPSDKSFRIATWTLRHHNTRDSFEYFGFIQFADSEKEIIWLRDSSASFKEEPLHEELNSEKWYGAFYYQLVECKVKREKYYLLFAWDGNDSLHDKKLIEVLSFDKEDNPVFGKPVFELKEGENPQYRMIFTFANKAVMALRHEPKKNVITYENVEPADKAAKGIYRLYLPDGTYDYLTYKKGMWRKNTLLFDNTKGTTQDD